MIKEEVNLLKELKNKLSDRTWRLNNLYWTRDASGANIKFVPNAVQREIIQDLHTQTVILKARQFGVTTLFCILWLDEALFSFKTAAIIAHTASNAEEIFNTKVKYAWDRLPDFIKGMYILNADNAKMLKFKRGEREASIAVTTSLRSGTVQRLLVTELGTLDQKYPEKSNEIKTGALNTVHKGQVVVIESTAKGMYGNFYEICKMAQELQQLGKPITEMDWKFMFFPWFLHPEYFRWGIYTSTRIYRLLYRIRK